MSHNLRAPVPILRMFDEAATRAFYLDFLDFVVDFEHRFAPDLPLYLGIARDGCMIHLSQHHGDGCPGARLRIQVDGLEQFSKGLADKSYGFSRPGKPESMPWGERQVSIADPSGNRLVFYQPSQS